MLGRRKPRNVTEAGVGKPTPTRPSIPAFVMFRMFVIGSVAIVACIWAIHRHYTVGYQKMLVPVPAPTEIEIETTP